MTTNEIKKGMKVKSGQLGSLVTGTMLDNKKGNIRLLNVKGSEVGLFDEMGSVYSHEIMLVEVDGEWKKVEHTESQLKLKDTVERMV